MEEQMDADNVELNDIEVDGLCTSFGKSTTIVVRGSGYGNGNCDENEVEQMEVVCTDGEDGEEIGESTVQAPSVGMKFSDWEEVEKYVKQYGKQEGFGWSRAQGVKCRDTSKRRAITWKCECWGDPDMRTTRGANKRAREMEIGGSAVVDEGKKRKRRSKKCNCPVIVYAHVDGVGWWVIRKAVLEHKNHVPKPPQSRLVKEYRMHGFTSMVRRRIFNDVEAGVPVSTTFASLSQERLGEENLPFTVKDVRHEVDKHRRIKMEGGDAKAMIAYFDRLRRENVDFFHSHRTNNYGALKDVVWVEARSRAAYEEFGDVVCFDTTYLTNEYTLPFANFVGVNHHGQSTLLGCALISVEDSETYHWVFSQWLLCMRGKAPKAILTDQAPVFRTPLEELMPDTKHRWCIWHILDKLGRKCRGVKRYDEFSEHLLNVIYNSFTVGEFESGWKEVMEKYGVESVEKAHKWLSNLFDERHMWVPTYMKQIFWAGMRTTQRVESMNRFFDQFITRHTRLYEFGEKYTAAVKKRALQEKEADDADEKWWRKLSTGFAAEKQYRKIYTDAKYRLLQIECEKCLYVGYREDILVGTNQYVFILEDRVWVLPKGVRQEILTDRRRMYSVKFNSETKEASCDCKMFETDGILCRHIITVYERNFVKEVPEKYILRRWRRDVPRKHAHVAVGGIEPSKTLLLKRHENICKKFEPLAELGPLCEETEKIAVRGLSGVVKQLKDWLSKKENKEKEKEGTGEDVSRDNSETEGRECSTRNGTGCTTPGTTLGSEGSESKLVGSGNATPTSDLKDPPIPKKRGRPKTTRFKSIEENGWKTPTSGKRKKAKKGDKVKKAESMLQGYADNGGMEKQMGKVKLAVKRNAALAVAIASQSESQMEYDLTPEDTFLQRNAVSFDGNL